MLIALDLIDIYGKESSIDHWYNRSGRRIFDGVIVIERI